MTAHEVDDAARRVRELTSTTVEDSALAVLAFGLALAATWYRPTLAVPLAIGALAMTALAGRALVIRFLLVDELAEQREAYGIPAVQHFGRRAASVEHRREVARTIRGVLAAPVGRRMEPARRDLERLAAALEDRSTDWDPSAVVALEHWLSDPKESFRDPAASAIELRSRVRSILAGLDQ